MLKNKWTRLGLVISLIAQAFVSLVMTVAVSASPPELNQPRTFDPAPVEQPGPVARLVVYSILKPCFSVSNLHG